jgi:Ulp1 family protease
VPWPCDAPLTAPPNEPPQFEKTVFVAHVCTNHWVVVVLNKTGPTSLNAEVYDSIGGEDYAPAARKVVSSMLNWGTTKYEMSTDINFMDCPRQHDEWSCGVHSMM